MGTSSGVADCYIIPRYRRESASARGASTSGQLRWCSENKGCRGSGDCHDDLGVGATGVIKVGFDPIGALDIDISTDSVSGHRGRSTETSSVACGVVNREGFWII